MTRFVGPLSKVRMFESMFEEALDYYPVWTAKDEDEKTAKDKDTGTMPVQGDENNEYANIKNNMTLEIGVAAMFTLDKCPDCRVCFC